MIWLIFAHFIGDWALQSDWVAQNKGKHWFVMFAHCMVWTGCVCAFYAAFVRNDNNWNTIGMKVAYWRILFLFIGHYFCDYWQKDARHLYIDQIFHLIQCAIIYYF